MTNRPHPQTAPLTVSHTHTWNGGPLPTCLTRHHHDDGGQPVIHTPDGPAQPRPGWTIVLWTDGSVTVASPTTAARVYAADGIVGRLAQAEADMGRVRVLAEQWVKAGPPPLGTSISRWWDKRLVELHHALNTEKETRP